MPGRHLRAVVRPLHRPRPTTTPAKCCTASERHLDPISWNTTNPWAAHHSHGDSRQLLISSFSNLYQFHHHVKSVDFGGGDFSLFSNCISLPYMLTYLSSKLLRLDFLSSKDCALLGSAQIFDHVPCFSYSSSRFFSPTAPASLVATASH